MKFHLDPASLIWALIQQAIAWQLFGWKGSLFMLFATIHVNRK